MKRKLFFCLFVVFFYSFSCYGQEAKLQRQRELKKQALTMIQNEYVKDKQDVAVICALKAIDIALDKEMDECTQRIMLYEKLYQEYNDSATNVNDFANKILANNIMQKNLGVTLNSVNDVKCLFSKGKIDPFRRACLCLAIIKASKNAQETLKADMQRKLSLIEVRLKRGERVKWIELQTIFVEAGYTPQQADKMLEEAGFYKFNFD